MKARTDKIKAVVILGPTASGKTALAVRLARAYNGEVVSADSRQVYRGMDIGTGKDLDEYAKSGEPVGHHLIDVVGPMEEFNLAKYQKLAWEAIQDIHRRGKLPIIAGGAGLYLQAIVDGYELSEGGPDKGKRAELESLGKDELFSRLHGLKPEFADKLNNSDRNNPRRLVRYLEIFSTDAKPAGKKTPDADFLLIGLDVDDGEMRERIRSRILRRLEEEDMAGEVDRLHDAGVDWKRLASFGLEYRFISYYLTGKLEYDEMVEKLSDASYRFGKRQKTWFRRWEKQGRKIWWAKSQDEAERMTREWLMNRTS
ncbi:MAG: tRNA (adenosine(37)-N6)-dimethylallyltransferase MiaA [Bacillota bacterium]